VRYVGVTLLEMCRQFEPQVDAESVQVLKFG